jgi:hypothetical protein
MPVKLSTTIKNIESLESPVNYKLIFELYNYLKSNNTSESYQNQNIKALINFATFLGPSKDFYQLSKKEDIHAFLNTKMKSKETDTDGKWIRTWNDYLQRIKYFIRWLHNEKQRIVKDLEPIEPSDWTTPSFVKIKEKKSKRNNELQSGKLINEKEVEAAIKNLLLTRKDAIKSIEQGAKIMFLNGTHTYAGYLINRWALCNSLDLSVGLSLKKIFNLMQIESIHFKSEKAKFLPIIFGAASTAYNYRFSTMSFKVPIKVNYDVLEIGIIDKI